MQSVLVSTLRPLLALIEIRNARKICGATVNNGPSHYDFDANTRAIRCSVNRTFKQPSEIVCICIIYMSAKVLSLRFVSALKSTLVFKHDRQ